MKKKCLKGGQNVCSEKDFGNGFGGNNGDGGSVFFSCLGGTKENNLHDHGSKTRL